MSAGLKYITEIGLIIRRWDNRSGLTETTQHYPTLEALYDACLTMDDADMIDRVVIRGMDEAGVERTLTLSFQSISIRAPKKS